LIPNVINILMGSCTELMKHNHKMVAIKTPHAKNSTSMTKHARRALIRKRDLNEELVEASVALHCPHDLGEKMVPSAGIEPFYHS